MMLEGLFAVCGFDVVGGCVWLKTQDVVRVDVGGRVGGYVFAVGRHDGRMGWKCGGGDLMSRKNL